MANARRGALRGPCPLSLCASASRAADMSCTIPILQGVTNGPASAGLFYVSITYQPTSKVRGDTRPRKHRPGTRLPDTLQAAEYSHHSPPQHHARRQLTPRFPSLPSERHRPRRGGLSPAPNPRALPPCRIHLQRHDSPYTALCRPYPSASTGGALRAVIRPLVDPISFCAGSGFVVGAPGTCRAVCHLRSPRSSRFLFPSKDGKSPVRRA